MQKLNCSLNFIIVLVWVLSGCGSDASYDMQGGADSGTKSDPEPTADADTGNQPVAIGGDCTDEDTCATGYCLIADSCPGTCTAYASVGEDCSEGQLCAEGLRCDGSECVARAAAGAACDANYPAESCVAGYYCSDFEGEICIVQSDIGVDCFDDAECKSGVCSLEEGLCVEIGAAESLCSIINSTAQCQSGLFCAGNGPGEDFTCQPQLSPGEECLSDDMCSSGRCNEDGFCDAPCTE